MVRRFRPGVRVPAAFGERPTLLRMGQRPKHGPVELPTKVEGEHRWIASVAYTLTTNQAAAAMGGTGTVVKLDNENRVMGPAIGCVDCELTWQEAHASGRCTGDASPAFA